jgi:hypothetical protein
VKRKDFDNIKMHGTTVKINDTAFIILEIEYIRMLVKKRVIEFVTVPTG